MLCPTLNINFNNVKHFYFAIDLDKIDQGFLKTPNS